MSTFVTFDRDVLRMLSKSFKTGWSEQGEHLRVKSNFGALMECLNMRSASWAARLSSLPDALDRSSSFEARAKSRAAPLRRGAPRRSHSVGEIWRKSAKVGGTGSLSGRIISHLRTFRFKPISAARMQREWKSSERMAASPPAVTSSR
jgi:hypothetical protein